MDRAQEPMGQAPDAFEQSLRRLLHEQARRVDVPSGLEAMVDGAIARGLRAAPRVPRRVRALVAVAATLAIVVAADLVIGRPSGYQWAVGQDGDGEPAIDWDSGRARLAADAIRIEALGTFTGTPDVVGGAPAVAIHSDPGSPTYRTLEVGWQEQGRPLRLYVYFEADDADWWVTEMRTYDGSTDGEWIYYPGPLFRTPLGGTYRGDFFAAGQGGDVPGTLRIDDMRLTAFAPGTGPAPLVGCKPWRIVSGEPALRPVDLVGLPPAAAGARLQERGVCFFYRWSYSTGPGTGYSERWCVPPPTGVVANVDILDDGVAMIFVEDDTGIVREPREQPVAGWGCPVDERGAAPEPTIESSPGA